MPTWSKGCFACRQRKVKCDEAKPACMRCEKRGQTCPGYEGAGRLAFRSMNERVARRVTPSSSTGRGQTTSTSPSPPVTASIDPASALAAAAAAAAAATSVAPVRPSMDWESRAKMHFFHHFVVPAAPDAHGYLSFLPDLVLQHPNDTLLHNTLSAASMTLLGHMSRVPELAERGRRHYNLALRGAANAMGVPSYATSDCCLTSIILLQLYEAFSGLTKPVDPHEQGLANLVQMRDSDHARSPSGQALSIMIENRQKVSTSASGLEPPSPARPPPDRGRTPIGFRFVQLCASIAGTNQMMQALMQASASRQEVPRATIESALRQAAGLYPTIKEFHLALASTAQAHPAATRWAWGSESPPPQAVQYTFRHILRGAMWVSYWCNAIRFLAQLQAFIAGFGLDDDLELQPCELTQHGIQAKIRDAVDKITDSAPYMLGEIGSQGQPQSAEHFPAVGAFFLLPGLYLATQLKQLVAPYQRTRILDCLSKIGYNKGTTLALRCRERWLTANPELSSEIAAA